jgi:hypothetical protein
MGGETKDEIIGFCTEILGAPGVIAQNSTGRYKMPNSFLRIFITNDTQNTDDG